MTIITTFPLLFMLACSGTEDVVSSKPPPTTAPSTATPPATDEPEETSLLPKAALSAIWSRTADIRSAVGGGHYAKGIIGRKPYEVTDPSTGESVRVGIPVLVMDGEKPRVFPTSAHEGHAIFQAAHSGATVLLDYRLTWKPDAARIDGSVGGFVVEDVVILQRDDAPPYAEFQPTESFWVRVNTIGESPHGGGSSKAAR